MGNNIASSVELSDTDERRFENDNVGDLMKIFDVPTSLLHSSKDESKILKVDFSVQPKLPCQAPDSLGDKSDSDDEWSDAYENRPETENVGDLMKTSDVPTSSSHSSKDESKILKVDFSVQPKLPCQVPDSLGDKSDSDDEWSDAYETEETTTETVETTFETEETTSENDSLSETIEVLQLADSASNTLKNLMQQFGTSDLNIGIQSIQAQTHEMADRTIEKPFTPRELCTLKILSSEVVLGWDKPNVGSSDVHHYEIKYRESASGTAIWSHSITSSPTNTIDIENLKGGVEFEFKVRAIDKDGEEGPFCIPSLKVSTISSIADVVKQSSTKLTGSSLSVYKLPLVIPSSSIDMKYKTRKCIFGKPDVTKLERTIMVVGATGAGKSTLIDGMINYIMDVSWDSDFRFSLVDLTAEENSKLKDQALSQTEWITCYEIAAVHGSKIDFNLNIIDTPGFGDTRGIVRDKAITDQIREFFKNPGKQGVSSLNAVCFVTQAPLARLTHTQKYVFDSILSIFGSDIANNIYVLMTFADGNDPPVLKALEGAKVPFQRSFKFNNSALFADNKCKKEDFGSMFWKMGTDSFHFFFNELKKLEPKSLSLTTEVLKIRQSLEATIQGLQPQITEGMHQLDTIRQEKHILENHKADIDARRNFVEYVVVWKMKKIDLDPGVYVTNCSPCNRTCHPSCAYADDKDKKYCGVMSGDYCTVCPQKCHWSKHQNNSFRFDTYSVKEKRTLEDLKAKFDIASADAVKQSSMVEKAKGAFDMLGKKVMNMIKDVRQYINKLDKIALRKNPLSDIDYINILIESEKSDAKPGWKERLQLLNTLKKEAEIIVKSTEENFNPWGADEGVLRD